MNDVHDHHDQGSSSPFFDGIFTSIDTKSKTSTSTCLISSTKKSTFSSASAIGASCKDACKQEIEL